MEAVCHVRRGREALFLLASTAALWVGGLQQARADIQPGQAGWCSASATAVADATGYGGFTETTSQRSTSPVIGCEGVQVQVFNGSTASVSPQWFVGGAGIASGLHATTGDARFATGRAEMAYEFWFEVDSEGLYRYRMDIDTPLNHDANELAAVQLSFRLIDFDTGSVVFETSDINTHLSADLLLEQGLYRLEGSASVGNSRFQFTPGLSTQEFVIAAIPEPSRAALFGLGLAACWVWSSVLQCRRRGVET